MSSVTDWTRTDAYMCSANCQVVILYNIWLLEVKTRNNMQLCWWSELASVMIVDYPVLMCHDCWLVAMSVYIVMITDYPLLACILILWLQTICVNCKHVWSENDTTMFLSVLSPPLGSYAHVHHELIADCVVCGNGNVRLITNWVTVNIFHEQTNRLF